MFKFFKTHTVRMARVISYWDVAADITKWGRLRIISTLLLNTVNAFAKILAPAALAKAVDMFALSQEEEDYAGLTLGPKDFLYISLLLSAWVKIELPIKNSLMRNIEDVIIKKHSQKLITAMHDMPFEDHLEERQKAITTQMNIINLHSRFATEISITIYQSIFDTLLGTCLLANRYGAWVGAQLLIYYVLDLLILNKLQKWLTKQDLRLNEQEMALDKYMNREFEVLNLEELVRIFNQETLESNLSASKLQKYLIKRRNFQTAQAIDTTLKLLPYFIANLIPLSLVFRKSLTLNDIDDFVFLFTYLNLFSSNMANVSMALKSCDNALKSIEQLKLTSSQYHKITIERKIEHELLTNGMPPTISFENVYFTYPGNAKPTLQGITFCLPSGSFVGVMGESSAGKSTIMKLLFKLFKPQSGVITCGGYPIDDIPNEIYFKIICAVPQSVNFFNQSLKYNVLYGSHLGSKTMCNLKELSAKVVKKRNYQAINSDEIFSEESSFENEDKEFATAMGQVNLQELLTKDLNNKKMIHQLSGGQKQRASIARALMRHSTIFVLDEAFSALDSITQKEIFHNYLSVAKYKSTLMITHRVLHLMQADWVIVLKNGIVSEQGTPQDLLEENGEFYNYWRLK